VDIDPADQRNVADLRLAATGDAQAQFRLSRAARDLVLSGEADEIVTSIEGVAYARLAAAQGIPDALMLLAEHCSHLAAVYYQCGEPDCGDMWVGQSIAVLDLATELLPSANATALADTLDTAAFEATPAIMEQAKSFRAIFAPAFGAAAFA